MKHLILILYPILLAVFAFYKARFSGSGKTAPEYLRPAQTRQLQAVACIGIILHHVTQQITAYGSFDKGPVTVFAFLGFLFTGFFFFCSGYGLFTSLLTKPDYLASFPRRRLPAVLIPFWIINLLTVGALRFAYGIHTGPAETLRRIFGLSLINSNGWFIVEITLLYLLFYAFFSLIRKGDAALACLVLASLFLILFGFFQGHDTGKTAWFKGEWWYNSTVAFPLGLLYARFRPRVDAFVSRRYGRILALTAILSTVTLQFSIFAVKRFGYYHTGRQGLHDAALTLVSQMSACIFFICLILLLNMRITIGNRALRYVAGIRTEVFLIHGFFVNRIFEHAAMPDFIRFAVILLCSLTCSAIVSPGVQWIAKKVCALLTPHRIVNDTLEAKIAQRRRAQKSKRIRIGAAAIMIFLSAAFVISTFGRYLLSEKQFREEMAALQTAGKGDIVMWGHFNTDNSRPGEERLTWIVLKRESDKVCLLSEKGIAGSSYHQKHVEVTWKDSDLHALLGSDRFTRMFSRYEAGSVMPTDGDMITLLRADEARDLFETDRDRELAITQAAENQGTNINRASKANLWDMKGYRSSWWWLKGSDDHKDIYAPIVTVDGTISETEKQVNRPGGAIRPLIWVRVPAA